MMIGRDVGETEMAKDRTASLLSQATAAFTFKATEDWDNDGSNYKAGDTISKVEDQAAWLREYLEDHAEAYAKMDDATLVARVKNGVKLVGKDAVDDAKAMLNFLVEGKPVVLGEESINPTILDISIAGRNPESALALSAATKFDDKAAAVMQVGLDGKVAWDASPVKEEVELERIYGKSGMNVLHTFPTIGSRKQKTDKDTMPWSSNEMADFHLDDKGEKKRFVTLFCDNTPFGLPLSNKVSQLLALRQKAANKGEPMKGTPQALIDSVSVEDQLDATLIDNEIDRAQKTRSRFQERFAKSVKIWQAKNAIAERFTNIRVGLFGVERRQETVDRATERLIPFVLCQSVLNPDTNRERDLHSEALSMTKLFKIRPNDLKPGTTTMRTLLDTIPPRKKKGANLDDKSAQVATIDTLPQFTTVLAGMAGFAEKNYAGMLKTINDKDGGQFAVDCVTMFDALKPVVSHCRAIAERYLASQAEQRNDRAQAEDEAERAAGKAAA